MEIGRLIVHPDHRSQGIGTRLMQAIEGACPRGARCVLFTGHQSTQNLYLYRKLGYREVRREVATPDLTMVFLEKLPTTPGSTP